MHEQHTSSTLRTCVCVDDLCIVQCMLQEQYALYVHVMTLCCFTQADCIENLLKRQGAPFEMLHRCPTCTLASFCFSSILSQDLQLSKNLESVSIFSLPPERKTRRNQTKYIAHILCSCIHSKHLQYCLQLCIIVH